MARYRIRARSSAGTIDFQELLTIEAALSKAAELHAAEFHHITLINVETGTEISDLEGILAAGIGTAQAGPPSSQDAAGDGG